MDNVERAWEMKQILLFHPAGQIIACFCGLFNIITGITKKCFILSLHINCGLLYYFMSALGFIMGIAVYSWAAEKGIKLSMESHLLSAVCIIMLSIAGAASGFMLRRKIPVKPQLRSLHKWINLVSMMLFVVQSITGSLALIPVM